MENECAAQCAVIQSSRTARYRNLNSPFSILNSKVKIMTEIKSLSIEELKAALKEMGEKPFRAGQIFKWLHEGAESFEEMSNLSRTYGRV